MIKKLIIYSICVSTIPFSYGQFNDPLRQEENRLKNQKTQIESDNALFKAEKFLSKNTNKEVKEKEKSPTGKSYKINSISIDHNNEHIKLNFNPILKKYENRDLTTSQILDLIKELTEVLNHAGYSTSAIGLKDNDISEGKLKLIIHWGKVKGYKVNNEFPSSFKDKAMLMTLPNLTEKPLNIFELDQLIELTNKANKSTSIRIIASEELEQSYIDLETTRTSLPHFYLGFNNSGAENNANGKNQLTASVFGSDLVGINDYWSLSAGYRLYKHSKRDHQNNFSANYGLPIGFYNLDFRLSRSDYTRELQGNFGNYKSEGQNKNLGTRITYLLERNKYHIINVYGDIDLKKKKSYLINRLINDDKQNKATLGISVIGNLFNGKIYTNLSYSQGLNWFGAKKMAIKDNHAKTMHLLNLDITWDKDFILGKVFNYQVRFGGQYSPTTLLPDSQLSIGDEYTVRGFKGSYISGDSGFYLSQTLTLPFYPQKSYLYSISPFIGFDWGKVIQMKPLKQTNISGFAMGIKANNPYFSTAVTYAKPLKNISNNPNGNKHVMYLNMSVFF